MGSLVTLWRDQGGVTSVETALVVVLVALAAVATWQHLAQSIQKRVESTNGYLQ